MPRRALKTCSTPGCPELVHTGRCPRHELEAERRRGSATTRGYGRAHEASFRNAVLLRDPICVIPGCYTPSTDADHHPRDRRELQRLGLNPNDPQHGRGLCGRCHKRETAANYPGGWNAR